MQRTVESMRELTAVVARLDLALADLERNAGCSPVARAIVLRLAAELLARSRTEMRLEAGARERLGLAPPEWN